MKMEKRKAIRMVAYLNDFSADVNKWRNSFYELWRYQMTWNFAYRIAVEESRKKGVYLLLDVRMGNKDRVHELLDDLGYRKIEVTGVTAGVFDDLEMDVDLVVAD